MIKRSQVPLNIGIIAGSRQWDEFLDDRRVGEVHRKKLESVRSVAKLEKQLLAAQRAIIVAEGALDAAHSFCIKNRKQCICVLQGLGIDIPSGLTAQEVRVLFQEHATTPQLTIQGATTNLKNMRDNLVKCSTLLQEAQDAERQEAIEVEGDPLASTVVLDNTEAAVEALNSLCIGPFGSVTSGKYIYIHVYYIVLPCSLQHFIFTSFRSLQLRFWHGDVPGTGRGRGESTPDA